MTTEREKIAARVRALRAMTVENGCTEDEAISAAEMLAKLLAKYNLTVEEAELRANPFAKATVSEADEMVGFRLWKVADGIAHLVGTKYYTGLRGELKINFFGLDHEVEISTYLLEICAGAMRREHRRLKAESRLLRPEFARRRIVPHLDGMADRLRQRLRAMKPEAPTGKGLVVLKADLIRQAMKEAKIEIEDREFTSSRDFEKSYRDGLAAADRVSLNPGLREDRDERKLIR